MGGCRETFGSYMAMILVQLAYGGSNILMKIALEKGLHQLVFIVYRHLIAVILLAPLAYVLERKQRPSLSISVLMKIFVLATFGTTIHLNVYYAGLSYTSPTVAGALANIVPSFTFIMAVFLRMEKVKMKSGRGWAKVIGTVICVGGSLIFTLWKGRYLYKSFEQKPLINLYSTPTDQLSHNNNNATKENWIKGALLILISNIAWSVWLILQAMIYKVYPARLCLNALICIIASVQSSLLSLFFARDPMLWKLGWDVQLLTIIYSGTVNSALVYFLQTWCISIKGPVFSAMFSPLVVVIVAIFSAVAFAERFHLGSLIGAVLIIVGLYLVLWGKTKDNYNMSAGKLKEGKALDDDKRVEIFVPNDYPILPTPLPVTITIEGK